MQLIEALVKDTNDLLPINVKNMKWAKQIVIDELQQAGFEVDVNESFYEMDIKESSPLYIFKAMSMPSVEEFKRSYDIVFVFIHMKGYAQENNVRVK